METRVINSMLQRPPAYVAPLPHSASPSGSTTPIYPTHHVDLDANTAFTDTGDTTYSAPTAIISPSIHGSPVGYMTPHTERDSYFSPTAAYVPLASPIPASGDSRVPGVTFEIVQQYQTPYATGERRPSEDALFRQDSLPIGSYSHSTSPQPLATYEEANEDTATSPDLGPILTYDIESDMALHNVNQSGHLHASSGVDESGWLEDQLINTTEYTLQPGIHGGYNI